MARPTTDFARENPRGGLIVCESHAVNSECLERMADEADLVAVAGMKGARRTERLMWRRMARNLIDNHPLEVESTTFPMPISRSRIAARRLLWWSLPAVAE